MSCSYTCSSSAEAKTVRIRLKHAPPKTKTRVKQWEERLLETFEGKLQVSTSAKVKHDTFKNAWSLFGGVGMKNKVKLRTFQNMQRGDIILLPQFDPNFFSPSEIRCRVSGCTEKKQRSAPSMKCKEDLYLCQLHRARLTEHVSNLCKSHKVHVPFGSNAPGDFDGYTSLTALMEKAYYCTVKGGPGGPKLLKYCPKIMQEVFLNIRNYLFITSAVLNPDENNLGIALPPVMTLLVEMMNNLRSGEFVRNLAFLLREVMETILFTFGVVYTWVQLALVGNPGAQYGMGFGGVGGVLLAAGAAFGPPGFLFGLGAGMLCGGLIGGGYYNHQLLMAQQQQQDQGLQRYREFLRAPVQEEGIMAPVNQPQAPQGEVVYHFTGNAWGDIAIAALLLEVLLVI